MNRRRFLAIGGALMLALLAAPALSADGDDDGGKGKGKGKGKGGNGGGNGGAQKDDDGKKKDKEKPDPKKTAAGRECSAVGAEFAASDSASIKARIIPKGKLRISLGGTADGDYGENQAPGVLDEWFKDKKDMKAELESVDGLTGTLTLTFGTKGSDKAEKKSLIVTLEKKDKVEGFWLTKLQLV